MVVIVLKPRRPVRRSRDQALGYWTKKRHVELLTRLPTKRMATACWDFIVAKSTRRKIAPLLDLSSLQLANMKKRPQVIHKCLWVAWGYFRACKVVALSSVKPWDLAGIVACDSTICGVCQIGKNLIFRNAKNRITPQRQKIAAAGKTRRRSRPPRRGPVRPASSRSSKWQASS